MGAHGWVARIASHWSVSLPRGRLISVEVPRHPRHPSSIQLDAVVKVHLTPQLFLLKAKIIKPILWSNLLQEYFDLVFGFHLIFYGLSKYIKMPPFWFTTEFNGAWVEGRIHVTSNQEHHDSVFRLLLSGTVFYLFLWERLGK